MRWCTCTRLLLLGRINDTIPMAVTNVCPIPADFTRFLTFLSSSVVSFLYSRWASVWRFTSVLIPQHKYLWNKAGNQDNECFDSMIYAISVAQVVPVLSYLCNGDELPVPQTTGKTGPSFKLKSFGFHPIQGLASVLLRQPLVHRQTDLKLYLSWSLSVSQKGPFPLEYIRHTPVLSR